MPFQHCKKCVNHCCGFKYVRELQKGIGKSSSMRGPGNKRGKERQLTNIPKVDWSSDSGEKTGMEALQSGRQTGIFFVASFTR